MSRDEAQSSRAGAGAEAKINQYYVFVKHLSYFSSHQSLVHYFTSFGNVLKCNLIYNKESYFMRSATVLMESKQSVEKILKQEQHCLHGKQIQVMKYHGMATHEAEYVEGKYHLLFRGLVDTSNPSKAENEYLFEDMYKMLENVFHEFEYITIVALRENGRYNGSAKVTFEDERNAKEIKRIAKERFGESFVDAYLSK